MCYATEHIAYYVVTLTTYDLEIYLLYCYNNVKRSHHVDNKVDLEITSLKNREEYALFNLWWYNCQWWIEYKKREECAWLGLMMI